MDKKYKEFEKTVKGKHSFRFTPKYVETFDVKLKPRIFVEIALKVFEKLDWEVVHQDNDQIEAMRKNDWDQWSNKITAKIDSRGRAEVKSVSLGNEMWDMGRNAKRVKLFIYAFKEEFKEYDGAKITELEEEIEKKDNWEDYELPEQLPPPKRYIKPQIVIPIVGAFLISVLLAFLLAYLSVEWKNIIILYESLAGLALGFGMRFLIRWGNYVDWSKLKFVIGGSAILIFVLNQYYQYHMIMTTNNYEPIGLINFLKLRLEHGMLLEEMNTGAIGYIIAWILQVVIIYMVAAFKTNLSIVKFLIERVPKEVIDFTLYQFVKGKQENEVRVELRKMGWDSELAQEMAFEAIGGVQAGQEIRRG